MTTTCPLAAITEPSYALPEFHSNDSPWMNTRTGKRPLLSRLPSPAGGRLDELDDDATADGDPIPALLAPPGPRSAAPRKQSNQSIPFAIG